MSHCDKLFETELPRSRCCRLHSWNVPSTFQNASTHCKPATERFIDHSTDHFIGQLCAMIGESGGVTVYSFKVVKRWQDDLMSSSDQTHRCQQLQNQGLRPDEESEHHSQPCVQVTYCGVVEVFIVVPWVPVVQAESNFVDGVGMRHNHVEAVLRKRRKRLF